MLKISILLLYFTNFFFILEDKMGSRDDEDFMHDLIRQSTAAVQEHVTGEYDGSQYLDMSGRGGAEGDGGHGDSADDGDSEGDGDDHQGTEAEVYIIKYFNIYP